MRIRAKAMECAFLLTFLAVQALAENILKTTVEGKVSDKEGLPLQSVHVKFWRSGQNHLMECWTNSQGKWSFENIETGDWQLAFEKAGYIDQTMARSLYANKNQNFISISLAKAPFEPGLGGQELVRSRKTSTAHLTKIDELELKKRAQQLIEARQWIDAIATYEALLQISETPEKHEMMAHLYMKNDQFEQAYIHYTKAYGSTPQTLSALSNLAEVCLKRKEFRPATLYLQEILKLNPQDPTANFNMAELLLSANEIREAIEHYEAAIDLRPDWPEAHLRLGVACLNLGIAAKAKTAFKRYLALAPQGADAEFVQNTLQWLQ